MAPEVADLESSSTIFTAGRHPVESGACTHVSVNGTLFLVDSSCQDHSRTDTLFGSELTGALSF